MVTASLKVETSANEFVVCSARETTTINMLRKEAGQEPDQELKQHYEQLKITKQTIAKRDTLLREVDKYESSNVAN
jgi:hypothetical protein